MNANKTDVSEIEATTLGMERSALDDLLAADSPRHSASELQLHPLIGTLTGFTDAGRPLVTCSACSETTPAEHVCAIRPSDAGRQVVLVFESGDIGRPIILGLLQSPIPLNADPMAQPVNVRLDGEQITLSAKNEIVLRCGKASITLTRAGKILIRGAYLLNRSSGVNRIKGGSVQIN